MIRRTLYVAYLLLAILMLAASAGAMFAAAVNAANSVAVDRGVCVSLDGIGLCLFASACLVVCGFTLAAGVGIAVDLIDYMKGGQ